MPEETPKKPEPAKLWASLNLPQALVVIAMIAGVVIAAIFVPSDVWDRMNWEAWAAIILIASGATASPFIDRLFKKTGGSLIPIMFALAASTTLVGCPTLPPPDGCNPGSTQCASDGTPQVCSQSQRWTSIQTSPCPEGSVCCLTRSIYAERPEQTLHACVPASACVQEGGAS